VMAHFLKYTCLSGVGCPCGPCVLLTGNTIPLFCPFYHLSNRVIEIKWKEEGIEQAPADAQPICPQCKSNKVRNHLILDNTLICDNCDYADKSDKFAEPEPAKE